MASIGTEPQRCGEKRVDIDIMEDQRRYTELIALGMKLGRRKSASRGAFVYRPSAASKMKRTASGYAGHGPCHGIHRCGDA